MRVLEAGPADAAPVVLVHGNLSTSPFYEHLMPELAARYRVIAPDMRGFGDSDPAPLDATRGLADWADDTAALLRALDVYPPQPMVAQIREVLDRYAAAGGSVRVEIIEGSGHGPHLDAASRWLAIFQDFLATIG